jgi:hypothetical protein
MVFSMVLILAATEKLVQLMAFLGLLTIEWE